ncbi:MAG: DUF2252 domain-containing protein [Methylococcus sp.]
MAAKPENPKTPPPNPPVFRARAEHIAAGKALREATPRKIHAEWHSPANRPDPVATLEASNQDRLPELIPIRHGRMLRSPFTFLRGSAGLMASDLAGTPNTGIRVQACGDCHLLNFGLFASPERRLLFDINDFDETLPAPWEWDVKRLAVSFVLAGRDAGFTDEESKAAAIECVRHYREHLRAYSRMNPLEVWYHRLDIETLIDMAPDEKARKLRMQFAEKARRRVADQLFPKITTAVGGRPRLLDQPPLLYHPSADPDFAERVQETLDAYRASLPEERRVLYDRYRLEDVAIKVVGIGSVGTRCLVGLFFSEENHPLLLQFKEACRSVLEPYAGPSGYDNQGQRVVVGQRLMQSSSDIFLGWARSRRNRDFYVRQMRDMKFTLPIGDFKAAGLRRYAEVCGWTLARAHARSVHAALISGYLGKSDVFDEAIGQFAVRYADQTQQDHQALLAAVQSGRLQAVREESL